jgi:hypothetical protein
MAEGGVEYKIKVEKTRARVPKSEIDSYAKAIGDGVMKVLKALNIGGGFKSTGKDGSIVSAVGGGIMKGLKASGIVGVLMMIADTVADFPMVTAIFKIFKIILTLLLLPLIPILKPVLILLGAMAKIFAAVFGAEKNILGAIFQPIVDFANWLSAGASWIQEQWAGLTNALEIIKEWLKNVGSKIWDIIKSGLSTVSNLGTKLWNFIKTLFVGTINVVVTVFDFIKGLFKGTIDVGTTVWNWFKGLFSGAVSKGKGIVGGISSWLGIGDGIVKPDGTVIRTDPNDYLFATKNPNGMSGGTTINITGTTVRSDNDIKTLVREISLELQKQQRRTNSYV